MQAQDSTPRSLPRLGMTIALTAATIGIIYGYDLGAISGALLFLKKDLGLSTFMQEIVTSGVVAGQLLGAVAGGAVANALGRKKTMLGVAVAFAVFAALSGVAPNATFLTAARILLGVTIGISIVAAPLFVAESAPARIRGALLVTYQVATIAGIAVAYFVDLALVPTASWRWMLGLSAIPSVLIAIVVAGLPDTARWYVMRGRRDDAVATIRRADPEVDAEREVELIEEDLRHAEKGSPAALLEPRFRKAAIFVLGLGFLIQITGINAVVYYAPTIFQSMGFKSETDSILFPALIQVASIPSTLVALALVDRWGRRPILFTGIGAMILADLLMMALFINGKFSGATSVLGFIGILIFTMGFNFGFGATVWIYASESLPARLRGVGASALLGMDLLANLIIALVFLSLVTSLGGAATFGILLVLAVIAFAFINWLAPETKGRELEEIHAYWENDARWPDAAPAARRVGRPQPG